MSRSAVGGAFGSGVYVSVYRSLVQHTQHVANAASAKVVRWCQLEADASICHLIARGVRVTSDFELSAKLARDSFSDSLYVFTDSRAERMSHIGVQRTTVTPRVHISSVQATSSMLTSPHHVS